MRDLTIISKIALIATQNISFEKQMNSILETIGRYLQVSRSYIFIDNIEENTTTNTFEWCNIGIKPQIQCNQNIAYKDIPSFKEILDKNGYISVENVYILPTNISSLLSNQSILSISIYPIIIKNKTIGFIGFDECEQHRKWSKAELRILETISGLVSNIYEKNNVIEEFNIYKNDFDRFFNTIGEFIIIADYDQNIIFANDYVVESLGYSKEELAKMKILDLYPVEKRDEAGLIIDEMINSNTEDCYIELRTKCGANIAVQTKIWLGKWKNKNCIIGVSKDLSREYESLQKFKKIFHSNPAPMVLISYKDEKFCDVNEAFSEKFGFDLREVKGKSIDDLNLFLNKADKDNVCKQFHENGQIRDKELRVKCKNGDVLFGLFSGEIIDLKGVHYMLAVMVDITKQIEVQNLYNLERIRLNSIIDSTKLGTWEWHVSTGEIKINNIWTNMIGYSLEEFKCENIRRWIDYVHPEDLKKAREKLKEHLQGKIDFYDVDYRMKHKDGNWVWINDRGKVILWSKDGKPLKMYGTHTDITHKKHIENQIKEISIRDPLTNIFNRRYIYERMTSEIERRKREETVFSLAILDIDRFKRINDTFGHIAGDFILKKFTQLISENLRIYDLLGRYGGEEFIILLYGIKKDKAIKIMERILNVVRNKIFVYNEDEIKFTFSVGIADVTEFENDDLSNEKIISLADKRLYQAKDEGRNRIKM